MRIAGPLLRGLMRVLVLAPLTLAVLIVLYGFLPVPSTLMLGRWVILAPVDRRWVPLEEIAPAMVRAVVASEDQRFCAHRGIDWIELRKVLDDEDGPDRGASTITMQVVKNVFLWPGRSVIRKGLELPLALAGDLLWGKRRVMEIYLNVAEWGEGLYGAEAASRAYFGKPARALTALEAARLAAALPNPTQRDPGDPQPGLRAATRQVMQRVAAIGPLADCALS